MIYVASYIGKNKKECEDTILVGNELISDACKILPVPAEGFVCVADGVGGNNGGKAASAFVLGELSSVSPESNNISAAISSINEKLIELSKEKHNLSGMATTLTGIYIKNDGINLIHLGNSRAYVMQGHYLKQLTFDHTMYNWLKSAGRLEEAEACNKSEITGCLGGGNAQLASKLHITEVKSFRTMLLTTDGIHDYVSIDELEDILSSENDGKEKCNAIVKAAKDTDSPDDLSVVIICMQED